MSSSGDAASTSAMDAGSTKQAEAAAASSGTERPAQAAVDERNDHGAHSYTIFMSTYVLMYSTDDRYNAFFPSDGITARGRRL